MGRRASSSAGMNLDSLMDTLTNVVGFLLILLVLLSLDAQDSIERIRAAHPEAFGVRPEDLDRAARHRQEIAARLAEIEAGRRVLTGEVAALRLSLGPAVGPMADGPVTNADPRALEAEIAKLEKRHAERDQEAAKLKAMLEKTPVRAAPPAVQLVLPDPKPAPTNLTPLHFMCQRGRIAAMDVEALRELAARTVDNNKRALQYVEPGRKAVAVRSAGEVVKYDPKKVKDFFDRMNIGTAAFHLRVPADDRRTWSPLVIEARDNAGETLDQIRGGRSAYVAALQRAAAGRYYLRFLVTPDSFDLYLAAREMADRLNVPAGWEAIGSPVWNSSVPGVSLMAKNVPPPSPAPATPAPKPPPERVLD